MNFICFLPMEILLHIFTYLNLISICNLQQTSKELYLFIKDGKVFNEYFKSILSKDSQIPFDFKYLLHENIEGLINYLSNNSGRKSLSYHFGGKKEFMIHTIKSDYTMYYAKSYEDKVIFCDRLGACSAYNVGYFSTKNCKPVSEIKRGYLKNKSLRVKVFDVIRSGNGSYKAIKFHKEPFISIVDLQSKEEISFELLRKSTKENINVGFANSNSNAIIFSVKGYGSVIDIERCESLLNFKAHDDKLQSSMQVDENVFLTRGKDCYIKMWDIRDLSKSSIVAEFNYSNYSQMTMTSDYSFATSIISPPSKIFSYAHIIDLRNFKSFKVGACKRNHLYQSDKISLITDSDPTSNLLSFNCMNYSYKDTFEIFHEMTVFNNIHAMMLIDNTLYVTADKKRLFEIKLL